ncbi:MAG TPA: two-component regulator propeller domain-containing protein [Flavobacteriales bacterium]|nr:two-component regulator propeller domain-containing protein [Flavobacteriales bacterium]
MIRIKKIPVSFLLPACVLLACCNEKSNSASHENIIASNNTPLPKEKTPATGFELNGVSELDKGVLCMLQDKNNNYWFGTNAGVYRYDGKKLVCFTQKDGLFQDQVLTLHEDPFGNIWFGTGGCGVTRFDGKTFTTLTKTDGMQPDDDWYKNWKTEPNDLWFYAGGGAYRYSNNSFMYLPLPQAETHSDYFPGLSNQLSAYGVYSILKDKKGRIWFGTQAMGVCCYDGKSFTWLTEQGLRGPAVLDIFEDRNGMLWFGTNGSGLFCFNGKTLLNITAQKGLSNPAFMKTGKPGPGTLARAWAINEDTSGNVWIGTGEGEVWRYDGNNVTRYGTKNGLSNAAVEVIYKDKKGELWFGTNGAGVYKLNNGAFTHVVF